MSRAPYALRTWLLRAVAPDHGGPATKNILRGIARHHGLLEQFDRTFRKMLATGELVMLGKRKNVTYGPPSRKRLK